MVFLIYIHTIYIPLYLYQSFQHIESVPAAAEVVVTAVTVPITVNVYKNNQAQEYYTL